MDKTRGIGARFVKETSYHDFSQTGRRKGQPQPAVYWEADDEIDRIFLPMDQDILPDQQLWRTLQDRRSRREFGQGSLRLQELSFLCAWTTGIQKEIVFNGKATLRAVPSAGAKHAIETILLVRRVEGLAPGLYRYLPQEHALIFERFLDEPRMSNINEAFASNLFQKNSAVTFFWIAVPERMVWHHGQRGYRNLYMDAGHIGQNFYLISEGMGLAACTMCVFDDERLNALLELPEDWFVLYTGAVGQRVSGPEDTA